jgi:hypothetical protein
LWELRERVKPKYDSCFRPQETRKVINATQKKISSVKRHIPGADDEISS